MPTEKKVPSENDSSDVSSSDQSNLIVEYSAVIQKLNAFEAWAHHFISLYFVFLVSLGAATGFVLYSSVSETIVFGWVLKTNSFPTLPPEISQSRLLQIFGSIGIGLNFWAVYMAREYEQSSTNVLKHLSALEKRMKPLQRENESSESPVRFATNTISTTRSGIWKTLGILTVGFFFLMIFAGWGSLLLTTL